MTDIELFLFNHGQSADNLDTEQQIALFCEEMKKGLCGKSSLPMVPTYLQPTTEPRLNEKKILLDAGGTNFRCGVGWFDENGAVLTRIKKCPMILTNIGAKGFYDHFAREIAPLCDEGGDVGYCFSYNVAMDNTIDGTMVALSKELDNPELVGTKVGKETLEALKKYDDKPRKICILNDTVATLLGGMACRIGKKYGARLGFILGTGSNVCYVEKTENIKKVNDFDKPEMIINCEAANYDLMPEGDFDKAVIAETAEPSRSRLEKMTGGKYLASIACKTLQAAEKEGMFAGKCEIEPFQTKDMSEFLEGKQMNIYAMFSSEPDRLRAQALLNGVIKRAAKLSAIALAAVARFSDDGTGKTAVIVCEGTTYHKLVGFKQQLKVYLDRMLLASGVGYEIVEDGQDYNLVGSLLATFSL